MAEKRQFFGTDGVRAEANQHPMTPEFVLQLGQAAAQVLGAGKNSTEQRLKAVIGRDTRASGEMLEAALAAGLNSAGVDVLLAGIVPTPAVALLTAEAGADFGVVVSASHNPFEDNGIKFVHGDGRKLTDATELAIEKLVLAGPPSSRPTGRGIGRISTLPEAAERYIRHAVASMGSVRLDGLKIVLDTAHGAASHTSAEALKRLGANVQVHFNTPDGYNINADCGCTHPEVLEQLQRQHGAQVGMAHDGDADRIALCDETGSALDGDELLAIAAVAMLQDGTLKNRKLAVTVMSNFGLDEVIQSHGGQVIRTQVGDRYVLEAMREHDLNLGGEQSGHMIFSDWVSTGDGLIAGLQILKIMQQTGQPLSQLRRVLKKFPQVMQNVRVRSKPPLVELVEAQKIIAETEATLGSAGRVLLRYSGTESLIRVLLEGRDPEYIQAQTQKIAAAIQAQIG
jgi:phosphoglucosamine mutase